MALRIVLLTLALFSSLTITSQEAQPERAPYENPDAYDVYRAVLQTVLPTFAPIGISPLVISAETIPSTGVCIEPEGEWKQVLMPAIADYKRQNAKSYRLQPKFQMEMRYELLTKEEIFARFKTPGEGSWVEFSAVGFNRKRTIAVLWVERGCPGLCGGGTFHVLHKKNGKWQPLDWKGASCIIAS